MGGVDYADQKRNEYRIPVKSRRWYRYFAFFFIETAAVNAFILRKVSPNRAAMSHLDFRLELIERFTQGYSTRKRKRASTDIEVVNGKFHFHVHVPINRCAECAKGGQKCRATWGCAICNVTLCVGCFEAYHK